MEKPFPIDFFLLFYCRTLNMLFSLLRQGKKVAKCSIDNKKAIDWTEAGDLRLLVVRLKQVHRLPFTHH